MSDEEPDDQEPQTTVERGRAVKFRQMVDRPNMHNGLHYEDIATEYGYPLNVNVLIGEDMHRYFKKIIHQTNHVQVEKALLMRQNLMQTIRLILGNGYLMSHPELTRLFGEIYRQCPTLFDTAIPRSEQQVFTEEMENNDEDELDLGVGSNGHGSLQLVQHLRPKVIGRLKDKFIKSQGLPTRSSQLNDVFYQHLCLAYKDYQMFNIIGFGNGGLRYCKKVSFTDRATEHRITHTMGDFIEYRTDDDTRTVARLDYLFVHEYFNDYRLFAIVTQAIPSSRRDPILGLSFMHMSIGGFAGNNQTFGTKIVGLQVITATRPYLVPVIEKDAGLDLDRGVIYSKTDRSGVRADKILIYCDAWEAFSL